MDLTRVEDETFLGVLALLRDVVYVFAGVDLLFRPRGGEGEID